MHLLCLKKGKFDVATMGNIANVGIMAQEYEEHRSHGKTFDITDVGVVMIWDKNTNEV